jgi:hypothetical protein
MDQNTQGRRPHYNRGRRGPDRRGPDRRTPQSHEQPARSSENVDVEQIMRDIRARISQRHGIELSTQQIQELAARRLEAILDPRSINPTLMQQLRRGADAAPEMPAPTGDAAYTFEDNTLYDSHRGFLRFMRRLLNPILKLFFNPNPIVHALHTQAALNRDAAARETERQRLQGEWNALHYEILQRLVTEVSRVSVEMQALALRVESLGARVDFNDRKVRAMEPAPQGGRAQSRPPAEQPPPQPVAAQPSASAEPAAAVADAAAAGDASGTSEGTRRRRRRRRGRRGSGGVAEGGTSAVVVAGEGLAGPDTVGLNDLDEGDDDEPEGLTGPEPMAAADVAPAPPVAEEPREPAVVPPSQPFEQPTPPPDEPAPQSHEPPDPGPPDR